MKEEKELYAAPKTEVLELVQEGVICASAEREGYGTYQSW